MVGLATNLTWFCFSLCLRKLLTVLRKAPSHDLVKVAGVVIVIACILLLFVCVGSCRHSHSGSLCVLAFLKCLLWLTLPSGT